jgi:hypothetical protein
VDSGDILGPFLSSPFSFQNSLRLWPAVRNPVLVAPPEQREEAVETEQVDSRDSGSRDRACRRLPSKGWEWAKVEGEDWLTKPSGKVALGSGPLPAVEMTQIY